MSIQLVTLGDGAINLIQTRLGRLAAFEENASPLLKRIPLGELQARGVLREAVVTYEHVRRTLADAPTSSHPFRRARVLLLDADNRQVGAVGLSSIDEEARFDYLAERGCDDLVAALGVAEEFSEREGADFEARILVVQDLILQFLVLVPTSSSRDVYVLPLPPTFDHTPVIETPMAAGEFINWLNEAWSLSRP